jgi:hypothetical protein
VNLTLAYLGRSGLAQSGAGQLLSLVPNLKREAVSFDAPLLQPVRFREAISALHDVVISDLRYRPRDKTAYEEWKKNEQSRIAALRSASYKEAKEEILAKRGGTVAPDLERQYARCRKMYWGARQEYANYLFKHDYQLWRMIMPCDPVITVAEDVVFFECFSADESSYGCLTANREACFGKSDVTKLGTTNVDYSWDLFHHFQSLRTYRETRFRVDPAGFEVATQGSEDYREEKIDLPAGWLRGFMQIQSAMTLPMRKITLSREAVYSILAWLRRHKARKSPRALRFEMVAGKPPTLVLEPWEERIIVHGDICQHSTGEPIRIWGKQRLLALARLLPLAERFDVHLLGTGFPSFWVANMGEMQLTLGLSGWTTNDWTHGSALDLLAPPANPSADLIAKVARQLQESRASAFADIDARCSSDPGLTAAALRHLAHSGQVIFDLPHGLYRWRQIMPQALGEAEIGPDNPEQTASQELVARGKVLLESKQEAPNGGKIYIGKADGKPVELLVDADGRIRRGKCVCSHHYKSGLRMGPCRHLLALRRVATSTGELETSAAAWYQRLQQWARN